MPTGWIDWPWYRKDAWVANIVRVMAQIQHLQLSIDPHTLEGIKNAEFLRTGDMEQAEKLTAEVRMELKVRSLPKTFG